MNTSEALALLGLPSSASADQIRSKIKDEYRLWSNRVSTAPTVAGRQEAERRVEMLDEARRTLNGYGERTTPSPSPTTAPQWASPVPSVLPPPPVPPVPVPSHSYSPTAHSSAPMPQGWYVDGANSWRCTAHQTVNCGACYFPGRQPVAGFSAPKSRAAAGVLGLILGSFGVHRFYLGYNGIGLIMLLLSVLSFGVLWPLICLWGFIEGIVILCGGMNEKNGRPLQ